MTNAIRLAVGLAVLWAATATAAVDEAPLMAPPERTYKVDASDRYVFGIRWHHPVVRTGWHRSVGTSFGTPAVSVRHNLVIVGQGEGEIRAFDLDSGEQRWHHRYGVPFESIATLINVHEEGDALKYPTQEELVLLASRDGMLLALASRTGELRWQTDLEADCRAPIIVIEHQGRRSLAATTVANRLVLLDPDTGVVRWSEGRSTPTRLTVEGHAGAAYAPERGWLIVAFSDGYVEAYSAADGRRIWSRPLSFADNAFPDADADPIVVGERVFVASYSDGIFALNVADGQTVWAQPARSVTSLADHTGMLLAASADGYVWGIDQDDGHLLYRTRLPPGPASRMLVRDGLVVLASGETGLLVLDARTGRPLQATAFGGRIAGVPGWSGGEMALMTSSGRLYALSQGDAGLIR